MRPAAAFAVTLLAVACRADTPPTRAHAATTLTGTFDSRAARLGYRLDLPARQGAVPAVVIGHGSGRLTRDHCRYLADGFLARGFATLCYDKRGVGESTGEYSGVGVRNSVEMFDLLAADMAAAVEMLRARDDVDAGHVGLVGASQAGWIMPLAAASTRPAFMIALSGPAVSVGEENFYSDLVEHADGSPDDANARLKHFAGPHGYHPRPVLASLDVPGLWLLGSDDRSIPIPGTVAVLDELEGEGRPFTYVLYPGAGHNLETAPIWKDIDRWLAAHRLAARRASRRAISARRRRRSKGSLVDPILAEWRTTRRSPRSRPCAVDAHGRRRRPARRQSSVNGT